MAIIACGGGVAATPATTPVTRLPQDSTSARLVPPNFGTMRQDDISLVLQPVGVRVTAIPLDESVIRVLAPDS
jgi:hypothetical protein